VAQQPVAGGALPTDKLIGALPAIFDGNRERADDFIEELKAYIHLNQRAMTSYIQRLALTLTLTKGPIVAAWAKDMGGFFDTLTPIVTGTRERMGWRPLDRGKFMNRLCSVVCTALYHV
jgi:hypothetical protein